MKLNTGALRERELGGPHQPPPNPPSETLTAACYKDSGVSCLLMAEVDICVVSFLFFGWGPFLLLRGVFSVLVPERDRTLLSPPVLRVLQDESSTGREFYRGNVEQGSGCLLLCLMYFSNCCLSVMYESVLFSKTKFSEYIIKRHILYMLGR